MKRIAEILNEVCHTSERTFEGTIYTLADIRYPEYNGKRIFVTLEHGKHKYTWLED